MNTLPKVLVCDDDSIFQVGIKRTLSQQFDCLSAFDGDEALALVKSQVFDILLLDIHMRSPDEGLQFIPKLLSADPDLAIVMSTASTDFRTVREAMRLGAADYVAKDFDSEELIHTLQRVLERKTLLKRQEQQNFEAIATQRSHILVGNSTSIRQLRKNIEKIKHGNANVVITGETGTGKEVVARQLRRSLASGALAPFLAVDSATIQSSMAESILFGHERGAFTGATKTTKGIFEEAHGGSVYFDEISNMPLGIQAKLLRVLQEKEITRLGSSKIIPLEFRVICASNKDLEQLVKTGEFKDDLFQRLNVIPIYLPPLRERTEDIPELIEHFTRRQAFRSTPMKFTPDAIETLKAYEWPGNVRELGNLVDYVSTMIEGSEVDVADLPPKFRDAARKASNRTKSKDSDLNSFYEKVSRFEIDLLSNEYSRFSGNVTQLAMALGMDRSHLYTKLKEYGIHSNRKKESEKN